MPIDVATETIITLGEACRAVPPHGVSTATMARWIQRGVRGAKLATVIIGGRRYTSREAIARFVAAQNVLSPVENGGAGRGKIWMKMAAHRRTVR